MVMEKFVMVVEKFVMVVGYMMMMKMKEKREERMKAV